MSKKSKGKNSVAVSWAYAQGLVEQDGINVFYDNLIVNSIRPFGETQYKVNVGYTVTLESHELVQIDRRRKKSKYQNVRVWVWEGLPNRSFPTQRSAEKHGNDSGIFSLGKLVKFDSKSEYKRWLTLIQSQADGVISDLTLQPRFELMLYEYEGKTVKREYVADFSYMLGNKRVIEDVKGVETDLFKFKRDLLIFTYLNMFVLDKWKFKIVNTDVVDISPRLG